MCFVGSGYLQREREREETHNVASTSAVSLLGLHGVVRLDRQCEWLIDGDRPEVRDQVTVRRHGAQHLF